MGTYRVLLADRDNTLLEVYRDELIQAGYEVETAHDALKCLHQLKAFEPDVLVMDPELHWGGGEGVLTLLREEQSLPDIPVVLLCRRSMSRYFQVSDGLNILCYQKPMRTGWLVGVICELVSTPSITGLRQASSSADRHQNC